MGIPTEHYRSQINSAQRPIAGGNAIMNPRAKFGHRPARCSADRSTTSVDTSFGPLALAILASDLILLGYKCYSLITRVIRRSVGMPVAIAQKLLAFLAGPIRGLVHEISDVVFILALLLIQRPEGGQTASQAIEQRKKQSGRNRKMLVLRIATFVCLSLAAPRIALAQPVEVITPIELFDPDAGDGIRISPSLIAYPQATAEVSYDSNVFNFSEDEIDDVIASVRPRLVVRSDLSRHAFRLEAGAELRRYLDTTEENSEQFRLSAETLLELGSNIDVETTGAYLRGIERRGTTGDTFFSDKPVVFHDKIAGIQVSREGNKLALTAEANTRKRDYDNATLNGALIDLSFRDVQINRALLRADFSASERTDIFAEISVNEIDYENAIVPDRDSSGYEVLLGVKREVSSLVEVEAGVGFIKQNFDQAGVDAVEGFSFRLTAAWTPKPEWRLTATASRNVDPSQIQDSPAIITSDFRIGVQRAVGDRVLLESDVRYTEEDFRFSQRTDKRFTISARATYRLADRIGLYVSPSYRDQDGGDFGRSYDGFATMVGVRAAW
ncbi:hypothetical protein BPTFM16_01556 [Altererythrobacter insulae]|nr:hypothetical protein BPTFM16_01556 [Altererythrobacter insulae]